MMSRKIAAAVVGVLALASLGLVAGLVNAYIPGNPISPARLAASAFLSGAPAYWLSKYAIKKISAL